MIPFSRACKQASESDRKLDWSVSSWIQQQTDCECLHVSNYVPITFQLRSFVADAMMPYFSSHLEIEMQHCLAEQEEIKLIVCHLGVSSFPTLLTLVLLWAADL